MRECFARQEGWASEKAAGTINRANRTMQLQYFISIIIIMFASPHPYGTYLGICLKSAIYMNRDYPPQLNSSIKSIAFSTSKSILFTFKRIHFRDKSGQQTRWAFLTNFIGFFVYFSPLYWREVKTPAHPLHCRDTSQVKPRHL